jgi:hypothetical protein
MPAIELLRVAGDTPQGRFEVVRHRVAERLQLLVPPPKQLREALVLSALMFQLYVLRLQLGSAALDQGFKALLVLSKLEVGHQHLGQRVDQRSFLGQERPLTRRRALVEVDHLEQSAAITGDERRGLPP